MKLKEFRFGPKVVDDTASFRVKLNYNLVGERVADRLRRIIRLDQGVYGKYEEFLMREDGMTIWVFTLPFTCYNERKEALLKAIKQMEEEIAHSLMVKSYLEMVMDE